LPFLLKHTRITLQGEKTLDHLPAALHPPGDRVNSLQEDESARKGKKPVSSVIIYIFSFDLSCKCAWKAYATVKCLRVNRTGTRDYNFLKMIQWALYIKKNLELSAFNLNGLDILLLRLQNH
jgi:hypothetical protein